MKLSFSTLGTPHYDIDQTIAIAQANGYQGVEIRAMRGTVDLVSLPEFTSDLAITNSKFKAAGINVVCIGTHVKFCDAGKANQDAMLENARVNLEIAQGLDAGVMRIFAGPVPHLQGYLETIKWIREGHARLVELCKKYNVTPCIETHDDFSISPRVLEVIEGIDGMGVVWDIVHSYRFGETMAQTYAALGKYIKHVHIKDSKDYSPYHADCPLNGEGTIPIAEACNVLKDGGYNGYLSFEWEKLWHPEIEEPEVAIPHYADYMRNILR